MTTQQKGASESIALQFGFGLLAIHLVYSVMSSYTAFFMTDILGVTAATMGVVLSIGGLFDTFGIFVMGGIVNNTHLKGGKYRSWMFIAPPVILITYVLFYLNWFSVGLTESAIAIVLIVVYSIQQMGINTCLLTTNGLASVVGGTIDGRAKITARMMTANQVARFIGGSIFLWFVAWAGNGNDSKGYVLYALIFCVVIVLAYLNLARMAKPYDQPGAASESDKKAEKLSITDMLKVLGTNDQFLVYMIASTVFSFGIMFSFSAIAYFYQYVIGNLLAMSLYMSTSTIAAVIGCLIGLPFWKLVKSKKKVMVFSIFSYAASFLLCYIIVLINGSISNFVFLIIINIGIVLFNMQGAIATSFYMDTAEYGFDKTGKDGLPLMMSFANVPFKLAVALAGGVLGFALSRIGYQAGMVTTPSFIKSLSFIVMGFPAITFILGALILIFGYKLTDEKVVTLMESNKAKRAALAPSNDNK